MIRGKFQSLHLKRLHCSCVIDFIIDSFKHEFSNASKNQKIETTHMLWAIQRLADGHQKMNHSPVNKNIKINNINSIKQLQHVSIIGRFHSYSLITVGSQL